MRYVLVDDSIPYDGYTSGRRPLGGAEKAVAGLATALQLRGHDVHVINRSTYAHMSDGAYYTPFDDPMTPKAADVLIAMRKPALLGQVRAAGRRILWAPGPPDYLTAAANKPLWDSFRPGLMFVSHAQARAYKGQLKYAVVAPGVRAEFAPAPPAYLTAEQSAVAYGEDPAQPTPEPPPPVVTPPHAIVTTHPLQGLTWLLDMWQLEIHPQMPNARLAVYSASLSKAISAGTAPDDIVPVLHQVQEAAEQNVVVVDPLNDEGMAGVYRAGRVHLYPGNSADFACWTLGESQATGLPVVARPMGGIEERVVNGQTGYIVPDTSAFVNVTLEILRNDAVHKNLSTAAGDITRRRTWSDAAAEVDAFAATLPATA